MNSPVEFFNTNIQIGINVLQVAHRANVKLMNLGSTCIYPKICPQPMKEEHLMSGPVDPTNEGYAMAKISTLRLCEWYNKQYGTQFISAMPTNVYGVNDNYHPENSHALPAMIRKVHEAKMNKTPFLEMWGDGSPVREFIHSDDLAEGLVFLMDNYDGSDGFVNIGTGKGATILELYKTVMRVIGYDGDIKMDTSKPNGNPLKVCDTTKINDMGWSARIKLEDGIRMVYEDLKAKDFKWKEV
jgi:GDP-L-fucose synthase